MSKFHLTPKGASPCNATQKPCPLGGDHFESRESAEAAFAARHGGSFGVSGLPKTSIVAAITPQAGGRYFGVHVPKESLTAHLEAFRREVSPEVAAHMEELKAARDRGYVYHLTTIGPPEMRALKGVKPDLSLKPTITYRGVGRAEDKGSVAWFVVCESPELQAWRAQQGLPPKDFHITLGFDPKDVHSKSKGLDSIVIH